MSYLAILLALVLGAAVSRLVPRFDSARLPAAVAQTATPELPPNVFVTDLLKVPKPVWPRILIADCYPELRNWWIGLYAVTVANLLAETDPAKAVELRAQGRVLYSLITTPEFERQKIEMVRENMVKAGTLLPNGKVPGD